MHLLRSNFVSSTEDYASHSVGRRKIVFLFLIDNRECSEHVPEPCSMNVATSVQNRTCPDRRHIVIYELWTIELGGGPVPAQRQPNPNAIRGETWIGGSHQHTRRASV
jgi:hypothetical protein